MSVTRQIVLSILVVVAAAAGWFAYDRAMVSPAAEGDATARTERGGGIGAPGFARGGGAPVIVAAVETDDIGLEVRAIGTVAAVRAVTLFSEATGIVADVAFAPGTRVTAGDVLVRLGDADQQIAVERARIALDIATASSERADQLARSNNITAVALTDARNAVLRAEIDKRSAEIDLAKRTVTAPFDGTIGLTDLSVGDLLTPSKPIATLDDMSTVTVAFDLPERASGRVAVGQQVSATTVALPDRVFTGTVSAVDSRVDPTSRTLKVEARLPNDANVLRPGMAVSVALSFAGEQRPVVPSAAVQWDRGGAYVWRLDGDVVHRADVRIVGRRSGTVVVAGGLTADDTVVVEGLQRLREGTTVTLIGDAADTAGDGGGDGPRRPPGPGAESNS